jgi:hypothetical protein
MACWVDIHVGKTLSVAPLNLGRVLLPGPVLCAPSFVQLPICAGSCSQPPVLCAPSCVQLLSRHCSHSYRRCYLFVVTSSTNTTGLQNQE